MEKERSLVLVKPDGVKRGLIGEIVGRIEKTGLKIIGMKMVWADEELAVEHYPITEEWAKGVFDKAKVSFAERGKEFNPEDHVAYGKLIQKWNMDFLTEGPVVAVVFEGFHAVSTVRKIVGPTDPSKAPPGTIRGDFLFESTALANEHDRTLRNLMHASGSADEAKREINLWFVPEELHEYKNIHETH